MIKVIIFIPVLGLFAMCASLSSAGEKVRYAVKEQPPAGCTQLPVDFESSFFEVKERGIDQLRNRVAKEGGNFLVVNTFVPLPEGSTMTYMTLGRGFICPYSNGSVNP